VAIYDKSVEYISGGSNVPEIKEFFWKWRRSHNPQTESSLDRWFGPMIRPNTVGMADLGVFGGTVADEFGVTANGMQAVSQWNAPGSGPRSTEHRMMLSKEMALPAPAGMAGGMGGGMGGMAPGMVMAPMAEGKAAAKEEPAPAGGKAPLVQPTIRTKFADTALWVGALTTEKDGTAEVSLDMPENLTTWRIKVWGMGHGTKVGQGQADVVTRKDLIIRMEAPRFFVQTDEVVLSAVVHNY